MDDICTGLSKLESIFDGRKSPGKLKLSVLRHITANFSEERKIGEGGCGHVYKGLLPSGKVVAVKKLLSAKIMDDRMFQQEVTAMMSVKHKNIIRFLGYCSHIEERAMKVHGKYVLVEERERLLCFDYMSKGSLADYVTDELRGLGWCTRFEIIIGICEGLYHLHKERGIIHMDLKPPNILLNDDLVPKITDFGISRHGDISKTISQERLFSLGYCAPEYQFNGKMSFKSDIYSLGVIIKEVVTGSREEPNIAIVRRRWRHRWKKSSMHTRIEYEQQMTKCLELSQTCQNWSPTERPNIQDIIHGIKESVNTGRHMCDAIKSMVEKKNSFLEDMLGIEPLELHFTADLNTKISHPIQMINDTDDHVAIRILLGEKNVSFGIPGTRRLPLCMLPNKDIILPRSSCSVTITLEALKKPLWKEQCIAELCVQSTRVDQGLLAKDITADMFKEELDKVVDMVNLTVNVCPPKHLLVVKPLELRYWPIEPKKLLPCSLQLTNKTDDYVAFKFILPQGKVLYYQAMGTGIMPPCSTQGVVIYMFVEEEALADMQCKDTFLLRSGVIDEGYFCDNNVVSMDWFNKQTGVNEVELDIMFAVASQKTQTPSSVHCPMYDNEQDWEDDELELTDGATLITSPLSIETDLLHIYPAELHFTSKEGVEYISLINKTDIDVTYVIVGEFTIANGDYKGIVPPQSTNAVIVCSDEKPSGVMGGTLRIMMISGSHHDIDLDNYFIYYYKREELMNKVRAEGAKAHEALLPCVLRSPYPESMVTKHHEVILRMDENGLKNLTSMDVHPTEPWVVTGHHGGHVSIWRMDPETSVCEMMKTTPNSMPSSIASVKFIARMQWIACSDYDAYITVYSYADNRLTEINKFRAEGGPVHVLALAVHPTLPYLLSSSTSNLINLWDWDQGWTCTRKFSFPSTDIFSTRGVIFNPNDANSFASFDYEGEINIWSIDSEGPTTWMTGDTVGIAYCNTGVDLQCMATVDWEGEIEILALQSNTATHVHTLEATGLPKTTFHMSMWFIACHPTRHLLATAKADTGVFLWNYTTYGLKKVFRLDCDYYSENVCLGFIDIEGFQRPRLEHGKNVGKMEESSSYRFIHHSRIWNKGISSSRFGGRAIKPVLLEERKHEFKNNSMIKMWNNANDYSLDSKMLVIAYSDEIKIVDIFDGPMLPVLHGSS